MISVIRTDSGTFNLFGTRDDEFILQGNLNEDELDQLVAQIEDARGLKPFPRVYVATPNVWRSPNGRVHKAPFAEMSTNCGRAINAPRGPGLPAKRRWRAIDHDISAIDPGELCIHCFADQFEAVTPKPRGK